MLRLQFFLLIINYSFVGLCLILIIMSHASKEFNLICISMYICMQNLIMKQLLVNQSSKNLKKINSLLISIYIRVFV